MDYKPRKFKEKLVDGGKVMHSNSVNTNGLYDDDHVKRSINGDDYNYISSLSSFNKLIDKDIMNVKLNSELNNLEYVDIVGEACGNTIDNTFNNVHDKKSEGHEMNKSFDLLLEPSYGASYVKDLLNKVNFKEFLYLMFGY